MPNLLRHGHLKKLKFRPYVEVDVGKYKKRETDADENESDWNR